jgi:8-oxo-dGTP pyrophosphatase MutT (NUDIX family)
VVAAVCYRRQQNGAIEFLLVRTRAGRWTFPKGGVDGDPSAAAAAAREAHEEAGVRGRVEATAFTRYLHYKNRSAGHTVNAHLCQVLHLETPREVYRAPRWFSAEKAKRRLREDRPGRYAEELARVVDHAVRHLESNHSQAGLAYLN